MYREWIGTAGDYVRWDRSEIIVAIERKLTTAEAIQLVRALHQALID